MKVLLLEGSVLQLVLPESELAAGPVLVQVFGKFLLQFAEQDFLPVVVLPVAVFVAAQIFLE